MIFEFVKFVSAEYCASFKIIPCIGEFASNNYKLIMCEIGLAK